MDRTWLELLTNQNQIQEVLKLNEQTSKFGLVLTKDESQHLVEIGKESLKEERRVEFTKSILEKIIFKFCDSSFISQDTYVETLEKLINIFYLYKNESLDELTDDELLEFMKKSFEGICQGSLEYLEGTVLEEFARKIRGESRVFFGQYKK